MTVLARGVSDSAFQKALDAFAKAVGKDHLLVDERASEFRDPYAFIKSTDYLPSAVVQPASVEEVQAIVKIANEHRIPLWTSSQGRNNGYGGSAPRVNGSVVVNLRRMDKVLEVSEKLAYALVEPGVSFVGLYEHLKSKGYKLWVDAPDLEWGSVIGNTLEHGVGYTVYGDHAAAACGMEVVLANGEVIRTGMGALPGSKTWNAHKRGFGPTADGIFMQSNFGIVTKMGMWLMPEPECWRSCWVSTRNYDDLGPLVETLRPLLIDGTVPNTVTVFNLVGIATVVSRRADWFKGKGSIPDDVQKLIAEKLNVGQWNARCALYGPEEVVEAKFKVLERAVARLPGAELVSRKYPGNAKKSDVAPPDHVIGGHTSMDILETLKWSGAREGGHIGFSPIGPVTGEDAVRMTNMTRDTLAERGFDYAGGLILTQRSMLHIALILFDRTDKASVDDAYDLCASLVRKASAAGYGEYRAHPEFMDLVEQQYSWNGHALRRFNETIKDAVDPNGILSPGRHGIWPAARRAERKAY